MNSKWVLNRSAFTENSTIGDLTIDDAYECHILEPTWRGNDNANHVEFKTALSSGSYKIRLVFSPAFGRIMPHIYAVTDYSFGPIGVNEAGILLHWGNYPKDTKACMLCGKTEGVDFVGNSLAEFTPLYNKIVELLKSGDIDLEIICNHEPYIKNDPS